VFAGWDSVAFSCTVFCFWYKCLLDVGLSPINCGTVYKQATGKYLMMTPLRRFIHFLRNLGAVWMPVFEKPVKHSVQFFNQRTHFPARGKLYILPCSGCFWLHGFSSPPFWLCYHTYNQDHYFFNEITRAFSFYSGFSSHHHINLSPLTYLCQRRGRLACIIKPCG
jgi:hypothetical protein